ncbi:Fanconi anemia group C protein isoform X3 [Oryzias melastigma]|uniref:Fanconi anemia group C protein isoform X3 n=1 Tax=Oryzias melastigma TaxID=30732 RepID=UPI000CF7D767|nr:Fanconi anemia group C protein isoform X3 [Oryzias melastigma]
MTELQQPLSQLQETSGPLLDAQKMQFWMDKAVAWDQVGSAQTLKDISRHLRGLTDFLQQVLTQISNTGSTAETMKELPCLGQILGRLCWNPYVTVGDTNRGLLLQCLLGLYSENPSNALERKANQWIRKVLCRLATEDDDPAAQILMKSTGVPPKEYHLRVLKKMVKQHQENIEKTCCSKKSIDQRCSCDVILTTSEVFVPLLDCPEASPVICSLLQRPGTSFTDALSEDFLDALNSTDLRLAVDETALVSVWYHSLPRLEEAVLDLLEFATSTGSAPQNLEQHISKTQLPKACAHHCSMFLVVNDIFRSILKQAEGNLAVHSVIQTFTRCFLKELEELQPRTAASLKAFFPQSPTSLLVPLLTLPSEMPQEAWKNHLEWLTASLQRLAEQEEEEEGDSQSSRGHHNVFETWFLLVQCSHWVQVAGELLVTSEAEPCSNLLWLMTFYYHPTNRWHCRAALLEEAKEAWRHLRTLSSASVRPLPTDHLQPLITLLSLKPQRPSAPLLTLSLMVYCAIFCQLPHSQSVEIFQTVVHAAGLLHEAACVLNSLQHRLNEGSCSSRDTVHVRIKKLQSTVTHMQAGVNPHTPHNRRMGSGDGLSKESWKRSAQEKKRQLGASEPGSSNRRGLACLVSTRSQANFPACHHKWTI